MAEEGAPIVHDLRGWQASHREPPVRHAAFFSESVLIVRVLGQTAFHFATRGDAGKLPAAL